MNKKKLKKKLKTAKAAILTLELTNRYFEEKNKTLQGNYKKLCEEYTKEKEQKQLWIDRCKQIKAEKKENTVETLPENIALLEMDERELNALVAKDEAWGRMVCRCEKVSEAEIVRAIHSPLPATTVDAVKRRTRAGMGRCQGGFCGPRVMEIISRELGIPLEKVRKGGGEDSNIAVCKVKEVE